MPPITLWFLQSSRCIRTAWLLEELNLPYNLKFSDRVNARAPDEFRAASGNPLGKFPTLQDGNLTIYESGAINDYLCETYDKEGKLFPHDPKQRNKVRQWVHAAEATVLLHAIAIYYARSYFPKNAPAGALEATEKGMSANVQADLAWLESELSASPGKFLCGDHPTAADIMMQVSAEYILKGKLGTQGKEYPMIEKWLEACKETESYKRAVQKTGHKL
ncbi:glutathione S-transferase [Cucurbitaria berberidis CBS 394.84]|uniref:Glutathione S-transferase n=1 Tax=Cucurbitaria berberidis CBS 394.84 TaxID=1168544 RepID=A0A9P4G925_9PLEO|nr:glutathione S-transferase [Cucurbitaria berberidis CBS 394.84]KAF1841307.1 glutathione S-transferase [Cucurbitaria berberidis CBS 394.84]